MDNFHDPGTGPGPHILKVTFFFFFLNSDKNHPNGLDGKESVYKVGDPDLLLGKNLLENGMATHCSILAWRIPWTEVPGGLQSMGSHIVRA